MPGFFVFGPAGSNGLGESGAQWRWPGPSLFGPGHSAIGHAPVR
jgi:hypothetical protein